MYRERERGLLEICRNARGDTERRGKGIGIFIQGERGVGEMGDHYYHDFDCSMCSHSFLFHYCMFFCKFVCMLY